MEASKCALIHSVMTDNALRDFRRARTLNQFTVASVLGITQQTYSKYESGRLPVPPQHQQRLSTLLGVSRDELFSDPELDRPVVAS